jgi:hypothetical protein
MKRANSAQRARRLALLAAAVAIASGAITLGTPAAHAIPESTIKAECQKAGGTYTTGISSGFRFSKCCYTDISGKKWCDRYLDGEYEGTDPAAQGEPGDTGTPPKAPVPTAPVQPPDVGTPPPPKPVVPIVPVLPPTAG